MILLVILAALIIIILFIKLRGKKENITNEVIIAEVGGLGSGKTKCGSKRAIKLTKKQLKKWILEKRGTPAPLLYSNIPITFRFKGKKYESIELRLEHLLMKAKVNEGSVIFIDEIGTIINQFDWNKKEVKNELTEFFRLFRQYTKGGYMVLTDQSKDNIVKPIRDRINVIVYNIKFNHVGPFYCNQCAIMRYTQQLDTYTVETLNNLITRRYGIFDKSYDTWAWSDIYQSKLFIELQNYQSENLKARELIKLEQSKSRTDLLK